MPVALDSPLWHTLRHAYGLADDVPALILAIQAEKNPNYSDGGVWFQVYSSLYHQSSVYSATYAAMPHIARIVETGTVEQRLAIMCLAGEIRISSYPDDEIAADLLLDFQVALREIKDSSLKTMHDAARERVLNAPNSQWKLGQLLAPFGGLRYPTSGYVAQLSYMVIEGWRVESDCPTCGETSLARFDDQGIVTRQLSNTGHELADSAKSVPVNRSGYGRLIATGEAILMAGQSDWPLEDLPAVLSALAVEFGEEFLAARILDLGAKICCAYCGEAFELSASLRPLF